MQNSVVLKTSWVISAVMEPFLKSYYDLFKYQSIDSFQFKDYFLSYFKDKDLSAIEWDKWFNQPGMPIYKPKFDESLAKVKLQIYFDISSKYHQ